MQQHHIDHLKRVFGLFFNMYDGDYAATMLTALLAIRNHAKRHEISFQMDATEGLKGFFRSASEQMPLLSELIEKHLHTVRDFGSSTYEQDILSLIAKADYADANTSELGWSYIEHLREFDLPGRTELVGRDVAELMASYLDPGDPSLAYCPMQSSFSAAFILALRGKSVEYTCISAEAALWAEWMAVWFDLDLSVKVAHPVTDHLLSDDGNKYDSIAMVPPWGLKIEPKTLPPASSITYPHQPCSSEALFLQYILSKLRYKAAVLLPPGFLSRTTAGDKTLKQVLLDSGHLEAIVQCPSGTLCTTSITPTLLLLNAEANDQPTLVKGDTLKSKACDFAETVLKLISQTESTAALSYKLSIEEAQQNDWNLDVGRYVLSSSEEALRQRISSLETVALRDIAEFVRCQALKNEEYGDHTAFEINQSDIDQIGLVSRPSKKVHFSDDMSLNRANRQEVRPGDILFTVKGKVGKVGLVTENYAEDWVAGQSFIILRLKPNSMIRDSVVLFRYLASPLAQGILRGKSTGAVISMIKAKDLETLPVFIPTQEQQQIALHKHEQVLQVQRQIADLERQVESLKVDDWLMA